MDADLAALHGYWCADGYVTKSSNPKWKYYYIGLRNTDLALLNDYQRKFKKVFGITPHISKNKDRCHIGSKEICLLLLQEFGSFHSRKWNMPIEYLNKESAAYWLKAFFDCEGSVSCQPRKNRVISAESVNHNELKQIQQQLLEKFGINSKIKPRKGRSTHALFIFGKDNLIKFKNKIGFLHPRKNQKLEEAINSYMNYKWEFPKSERELKNFVIDLMKSKVKIEKEGRIRFCSNIQENLLKISKSLSEIFGIETKVSKLRYNGIGTKYFELTISKKSEIKKLIENDLISEKEKNKIISFCF